MTLRRRLLGAAAVAGLGAAAVSGGCSTGPSPGDRGPARTQMRAHFDLAVELRRHAVAGDVGEFRAAAGELADLGVAPDLPPGMIRGFVPLRTEARAAAGVRNADAAARAAADVARACGECHRSHGAGLGARFTVGGPPPGRDGDRHAAAMGWVSRLLWDGLVGPSDRTWERGARALASGELSSHLAASPASADPGLVRRLAGLGERAEAAADAPGRARVLGEVWATCAGCHRGP